MTNDEELDINIVRNGGCSVVHVNKHPRPMGELISGTKPAFQGG